MSERDPDANVVPPEERDHREKPVPEREAPDVGDQQEIATETVDEPLDERRGDEQDERPTEP